MRISQVTGFLGSGKTTFLVSLAKKLGSMGYRVAVIVNDVGHINVDHMVMGSHGLTVKEVAGGCICCEVQGTFTTTVINLHISYRPDIILVEPSGVAIPWGLKQAVTDAAKNSGLDIEHSPIVTFVDGQAFEEQMSIIPRLVGIQVKEADAVMINKVDVCTPDEISYCESAVAELNPRATVIKGSAVTGAGLDEMIDIVLNGVSVKYDESVEAGIYKEEYGVNK